MEPVLFRTAKAFSHCLPPVDPWEIPQNRELRSSQQQPLLQMMQ